MINNIIYHIYILYWLVVWNMTFIFPYIGNNHQIFQGGRYITNQYTHIYIYICRYVDMS